nr:hypothetical protein [Sphingomonas elodea]
MPFAYAQLLSEHNGAQLVDNRIEYVHKSKNFEDWFSFCRFYDVKKSGSIEYYQDLEGVEFRRCMTFGLTASGDYLVFKMENDNKFPSIKLILHDEFEVTDMIANRCVVDLANDFSEFLVRLKRGSE